MNLHLWSSVESALTFAVMVAEEIGDQDLVTKLLVLKQDVLVRRVKSSDASDV